MTNDTTPKVYIADLAAYNNGTLHGKWVDAVDADEIQEGIKEVLATSKEPGAEEYAIHDYDNFPGEVVSHLGEYPSVEEVAAIGAMLEDKGELGRAFIKFADQALGMSYVDWEDVDELVDGYHVGHAESEAEYAEQFMEDTGQLVPDWLSGYVDWQSLADDNFFRHGTCSLIDGYVFDSEAV